MSTKRIRIVVLSSASRTHATSLSDWSTEDAAKANLAMWHNHVCPSEPYTFAVVEADIPLPEVATVAGTVEKVGAE